MPFIRPDNRGYWVLLIFLIYLQLGRSRALIRRTNSLILAFSSIHLTAYSFVPDACHIALLHTSNLQAYWDKSRWKKDKLNAYSIIKEIRNPRNKSDSNTQDTDSLVL